MNNILEIIEVERFGKALAHDGDERQAAVINALAEELYVACKGDNEAHEMQLCYISDKLSKQGGEFINGLAEFIKLRHKDDSL